MKRTTLIPVFLFIVILLAYAGNDLTITYSQQKNARVISVPNSAAEENHTAGNL